MFDHHCAPSAISPARNIRRAWIGGVAFCAFAISAASLADPPCSFIGEDQYDVRPVSNTRPECQIHCESNGRAGFAGDDPYCDNLPTGGTGGPSSTGEPASNAPGGIVHPPVPCGEGSGGSGGGWGPEFGGSGGIVDMPGGYPAPPATDWSPFLVSPYPVDLRTGNKLEDAVDLSIPMPGGNVEITRKYCSDPNFSRFNVVGEQWTMPWFGFLRRVTVGTGVAVFYHHGGHESVRFDKLTGTSVFVSPENSTLRLTERLSGSDVLYYILEEPGKWTRIFYGNKAPGFSSSYQAALTGALYCEISAHGRFTVTHWESYDNDRRRLQRVEIYKRPNNLTQFDRPNVLLNFFWRSFGTNGANGQRISRIQALRMLPCASPCSNPTALLVGEVKYTYWDDSSGGYHSDVGSTGDLVQVETFELADKALPPEDQNTPIIVPAYTGTTPNSVNIDNSAGDKLRKRVTQYRYYLSGGSDEGTSNQLKLVILPQQLEHYSWHTGGQSPTGLLSLADSATAIDRTGTSDDVTVSQLAAKVIKYATTTDGSAGHQAWKVKEELVQTNCGCASGASQGLRVLYAYFDTALSNLSAQTVTGAEALKRVVRMREERYDGAWKPYRQTWHDMIELDTNSHASIDQIERLPAKRVVEEMTPSISTPSDWSAATVARSWVMRWQYYPATDPPTNGYLGQLKSLHMPSATPGYTRAGVNDDQVIPAASAGNGLIYGFYYFTSGVGNCRLEKVTVRDGSGASESAITEFTYATTDRGDLPASVNQRRGTSDYETTTYSYTLSDIEITGTAVPADEYEIRVVIARTIAVEAETTGENGPGGNDHETTETYDNDGQLTGVTRPDGSKVEFTRDAETGNVTVRAETHTTNSGNKYETLMNYDPVGRLVRTREPSGATTNIRRELIAFGTDDDPTESGSPGQPKRWVETYLPAATGLSGSDGAAYAGPIVRQYLDAAHQSLGAVEYVASAVTRDSAGDLTGYTVGSELGRSYLKRNLAGQVAYERRYHNTGSTSGYYDTDYGYDELGRLKTVTTDTGTISRYTYDARNRTIQEEIGTSLSPDNLRVTAEYFYDDTTFNNGTLSQGVGDGNLSAVREWVNSTSGDARITEHKHDWRNRRVMTINPEKPVELVEYDNLNRPVARALFESATTALPSSVDDSTQARREERGLLEKTSYSHRGLVWRQERATNPSSTGTTTYLTWDTWYDKVGRAIKQTAPNSPARKTKFDEWGRPIWIWMTDAGGDSAHTDAENATGDTVYEQTELHYVAAGTSGGTTRGAGQLDFVTTRRRSHDYATTGDLPTTGSGAIPSYKGVWHDGADRVTSVIDFGTNTAEFASGGSVPGYPNSGSVPPTPTTSGYADAIVSRRVYGDRGVLEATIDADEKKTKLVYDDLGRQVGVLESYNNGVIERDATKPSGWKLTDSDAGSGNMDRDRATITAYDGSDNVTFQTAAYWDLTASAIAYQNTQYFYGVRESGDSLSGLEVAGSALRSNDLLARVIYPDGDTSNDNVKYTYNRHGELISMTDQAGNSHAYTRDKQGRVITDAASFASGTTLDTTIDGLAYTFDGFGRRKTAKSKSGSTVVNAVEFEYTDLWQVSKVKQNPLGDVVTTPGSTSNQAEVAYTYETVTSNPSYSRLDELAYPTATQLEHTYGSGSDAESKISRLRTLSWNGAPGTTTGRSAVWSYVGLRMPVLEEYPLTGTPARAVVLDRWSDPRLGGAPTSGEYKSLDRFGRVTHQLWAWAQYHSGSSSFRWNTTNNSVGRYGPPYYDMAYEYSKASDVAKRLDRRGANATDTHGRVGRADRDEVYDNDDLHRLTQADRGKLTSSFAHGGSRGQQWSLDALGNWASAITNLNGDSTYSASTSGADRFDQRKHNAVNEIDGGTGGGAYDQRFYDPGLSSSSFDLEIDYDPAGNMTRRDVLVSTGGGSASRWDYKFDAWNRLVKATVTPSGGSAVDRAKYTYNALHWRVSRAADNQPSAGANPDQANLFYYDATWRLLEERVLNFTSTPSDPFDGFNSAYEYAIKRVWDPHYIDDLIYVQTEWVDRGLTDSVPNPTGYYAITDRLYSVVGMVNGDSTAEGRLMERVRYTPYGVGRQEAWSKGDVDGDGDVDFTDQNFVLTAFGAALSTAGSAYDPACDFDMDGDVNNADHNLLLGNFGSVTPPAEGVLSAQDIGNTIGFDGYVYDPAVDLYVVRNRWYSGHLGRWQNRDPLGFLDSMSLYEGFKSTPLTLTDPTGTVTSLSIPHLIAAGFTAEEIAALLGVSVGVAESLIIAHEIQRHSKRPNDPKCKSLFRQLKSAAKSVKSLTEQAAEHQQRLDDWLADPDSCDHKGLLKDASPERRKDIIDGRARGLRTSRDTYLRDAQRERERMEKIQQELKNKGCVD